jgi:four helix bundle protein
MDYVESFRELEVYKLARQLSKEVFDVSKQFPKEEMYSLTDQVRRSSRSVGAQIAEAWGKRKYEKHFISKLTDADAEQMESQHWIETAIDCAYISDDIAQGLLKKCSSIGKMLSSMMTKSSSFCR